MGLIRKAIFIGGVIFAMPSPPAMMQAGSVAQLMPTDSTSWTYIAAAADTVADLKGFCERKPQVCVTAQYLASTMEGKAKYSAKLVYEWANESAKGATTPVGEQMTATAEMPPPMAKSKMHGTVAENSTLTIEDMAPVWRGTIKAEKG
ncbi:MAG: DUF5330 domain-containing protein [Alphaproteobacteria bacterium]|nr:DUF5330 domain-containing protein [Alphaproteobacteria bacterium]